MTSTPEPAEPAVVLPAPFGLSRTVIRPGRDAEVEVRQGADALRRGMKSVSRARLLGVADGI